MIFTQQVLNFIDWLRSHKALVVLAIIFLELLIGATDYLTKDDISLAGLHYLPIALAAIIYGMTGVILVSALATISFYISNYLSIGKPLEQLTIPNILLTFAIAILAGEAALVILRLMLSLQQSNSSLSEKVSQLQASHAKVEFLTAERERNRLARELHDGVAKTLLGVEYTATALTQLLPPENTLALQKANFIREVCHSEAQKLREIILGLREGFNAPLFQLVQNYLQRWQTAYGSRTQLETTGADTGLDSSMVYELMAILEEALENVQRHSQANRVWVKLETNHEVKLTVRDNGQGGSAELLTYFHQASGLLSPNPPWRGPDGKPRFGLIGMMERAEWLGGELHLSQPAEGGFMVEVCFPLHDAARGLNLPQPIAKN